MAMERDQKTLAPAPAEDQTTIKLEWKRGRIGVPHAFSRSSLFAAGRRYKIDNDIFSDLATSGGFRVKVRGFTSMSIYDLIVFLALMERCWQQDDDATNARQKKTRISCSLGDLASIMGHPRNTSAARNIFESLKRLSQTIVEVSGAGYFSGSLITLASDQPTDKISVGYDVEIYINHKLQDLYSPGHWAALDPKIIRALGRNLLAKWLYCFFASHRYKIGSGEGYCYGTQKLQSLSGSNLPAHTFVRRLRTALNLINKISYDLAGADDLVFRYALTKTKGKGTYKVSVNYQRKSVLDQMQKPLIDLRDVIYIPPEADREEKEQSEEWAGEWEDEQKI